MNAYGKVAHIAVRNRFAMEPKSAWDSAVADIFSSSQSQREKSCPRDTFLALCEILKREGPQKYTSSTKNRSYALKAVEVLSETPDIEKAVLWRRVCGDESKVHNSQMDVVISVFRTGFLTP